MAKIRNDKVKYDLKYLTEYYKQHNITLNKDYSQVKVNRDTRIKAKCLYENCLENVDKSFRQLYKLGCYCDFHNTLIGKKKSRQTNLERRGVEYPMQSKEVREKSRETCFKNYGVEHSSQSEEVREKAKQTNLERRGFEFASQSRDVKDKMKQTNLERRGVEFASQSQNVKDKMKQTCFKNHGVEHSMQSEKVREKSKQTNLKRLGVEFPSQSEKIKKQKIETCKKNYGVENPSQSEEINNKKIETCKKNYGVEHPLQSEEIRNQIKNTTFERFGVEYAMQNAEIAEKSSKKSYSHKVYTFPSGKEINVQGYEPFALDELIQLLSEDNIITGCSNVPNIAYTDDEGKHHKHFPDIFIPSQNKCIEVKSTWTAEKKKGNIFHKQTAGKQLGYIYEIWVYNGKGEKVNCYI